MATLPTRIRVGPFVYQVITDPTALRAFEVDRSTHRHVQGACNNDRLVILVDTSYPLAQQRDTLWHETKHAINYLADFGGDDQLGEEDMVGRTSSLDVLVLRDNPELVAYLTEADDADQGEEPRENPPDGPRRVCERAPEGGQDDDE